MIKEDNMRYRKYLNAGLLIFVFLLIASVSLAGASTPKPLVPVLNPGWNEIDPAAVYPDFGYWVGDKKLTPACSSCPGCSSDKFTFFAKRGTINKLVIFFQGGGACWDSVNCLYFKTYNAQETETVAALNNMKGIFDTTNPANPFKDWYVVYLPYCTGDLFWGANDEAYPDIWNQVGGYPWTIKHRGFVNFQVVLKWIKDSFRLPQEVFVTGSSAGGYGAIMDYPYIREAFPLTRVYVLGDAANGVTGDDFTNKANDKWNIQYPAWILPGDITEYNAQDIYTNIAAEYPLMKLAQYTTAGDGTQSYFYNLQLDDPDTHVPYVQEPLLWSSFPSYANAFAWHNKMIEYTHGTAATAPNYRYYIGTGVDHTILTSDKFYTENSNPTKPAKGVYFYKWVQSMVDNPFGFFGGPLQGIWKNVEAPAPAQ